VKRTEDFHCRSATIEENKVINKKILLLTGNRMKDIKLPELSYQNN
jgi:hypothetical protein